MRSTLGSFQVLPQDMREVHAGWGELALYAFTLALATGPFDQLIQQHMMSEFQRAMSWGFIYAAFGLLLMVRPQIIRPAVSGPWLLYTLPVLALLSTAWSDEPLQTLVASLEMGASAAFGAIIGCRLSERQLLRLLVVVLTAVAAVDLAVVLGSPIGVDLNGNAVGIFSHKNVNGGVMSILCIAATAVLLWGGPRFTALLGLALAGPLLILSGSVSSWLVAAVSVGMMFFLWLPPTSRVVATLFGVAAICAIGAILMTYPIDAVGLLLNAVDKDATLTGRTVLWDLAYGYIREAPLLGHGFNGFWSTDPTSASAFVDRVLHQELPHFHNGYLETAVELGWGGAALEIALMAAFVLPLRRLFAYGDRAAAGFAVALLIAVVVGNLGEVVLFVRHGFHLILMAALWTRASRLVPAAVTVGEKPPTAHVTEFPLRAAE
jgi:exopolysaccharide production protein ExoQ